MYENNQIAIETKLGNSRRYILLDQNDVEQNNVKAFFEKGKYMNMSNEVLQLFFFGNKFTIKF